MSDRILVGTRKGLFTVERARGGWSVTDAAFVQDVSLPSAPANEGDSRRGLALVLLEPNTGLRRQRHR